jgi:tetratricopeptide (TPR) repeat protein
MMHVRRILAGLMLALAVAECAAAQLPRGTSPTDGSLGTAFGKVLVRVRERGGAAISTPPWVRIYSDTTMYQVSSGSLDSYGVTFDNVPLGEYKVEVRAPGYQLATTDVTLLTPNSVAHVWVELRSEDSAKAEAEASKPEQPVMSPKARKELEDAGAALRVNDFKRAQEHLDRAKKLAPGQPDVHYMQGLIYFQQQNFAAARTSLETAVSLFPQHGDAQAALGVALYRLNEYPAAVAALEKAVGISPQNWQSHRALAMCHFQLRAYEKARAHVERAIEIAGVKAPELHVLLARVWIALKQPDKARAELESFLAAHSSLPEAADAQRLLAALKKAAENSRPAPEAGPAVKIESAATKDASPPSVPVPAGMPEPRSGPRRWAPPSVDDAPPVLVKNASCPLTEVLAGTAKRVVTLAENLERVAATEKVEQTELDEDGNPGRIRSYVFDYSVSILETRPGNLAVEEDRKIIRKSALPSDSNTSGLGAMALIFHPYYVQDFEMRCEGLTEVQGQPAWSVYFQQRADRPSRIFRYIVRGVGHEIPIKGRAWIAANTSQVLRLETDLVAPVQALRLEVEHLNIEYQPVDFKSRKIRLWLPAIAEMHSLRRGRRLYQYHAFSDYMVFAVDVNLKPGEVKQP